MKILNGMRGAMIKYLAKWTDKIWVVEQSLCLYKQFFGIYM